MNNISSHRITGWDDNGFDWCDEHGPYSRNARGKRRSIVRRFREANNSKFRKGNKVDIRSIEY